MEGPLVDVHRVLLRLEITSQLQDIMHQAYRPCRCDRKGLQCIRWFDRVYFQAPVRSFREQPSSGDLIKGLKNALKEPGIDEIFKALGDSIAKNRNKKLWLEKTPNHISYLKQIRDFFLNAPIIHIIRDGRDLAESLSRMHWQKGSYLNSLMIWKDRIGKVEKFMVSDKKFKNIRFEDLILDPDQTVKSICDFLGIEFEPGMLVPDGSEYNLIESGMKHKELIKKPINTDKLKV